MRLAKSELAAAALVEGLLLLEDPPSRCLRRMICRLPMNLLLHSFWLLGASVHLMATIGLGWTLHLQSS